VDLAELKTGPERQTLKFVRELKHDPDVVWRAVTTPEHLQAWFPDQVRGDWRLGGQLEYLIEGVPPFYGEVLAFEPPSLLEFSWGPDVLRIEIQAVDGGSRLIFTDSFDELGKAARDAAGWHVCLDDLEDDLNGVAPSAKQADRWRGVHVEYVRALGPAASAIGPPDGWDGS
jgi:uncharacterized protein YndB with AHSA1/START domain